MRTWDLASIPVKPHQPEVLGSNEEGRVIAIELPAGEALAEHQVHERAWLYVVRGTVKLTDHNGESASFAAGTLAAFDPNERREVTASEDSRLMLLLSPWPGVGHPSEQP